MKALELLYKYQQADEINGGYMSKSINEAIKELEALTVTAQQTTQNKFKVGDWVVHPEAEHPWRITQNSLDKLDNTKLKLWEPQPNEWCWVYNVTREVPYLRKVIRIEANYKNRFNDYEDTKAVIVSRGDTSGEVGYRFCEPFLGELPSPINNKDLYMKTNKKYMVVQIGCIECKVSSYPVGVYDTLEEAEKVAKAWHSDDGHHYVDIWYINKDNSVGIVK